MSDLISIGTKVKHYGTVYGIHLTDGERYYSMLDKHGCISFMPANCVQPLRKPDRLTIARKGR